MATLSNPSPPSTPPFSRKSKVFARKCERYCCKCLSFFPVAMVYGLTTWAVWVGSDLGFHRVGAAGPFGALVQIALYILLNWSYTTAVLVDPGSPLTAATGAYSILPNNATSPTLPSHYPNDAAPSTVTVKADGKSRFCKKCNMPKPDRAHHCSTCRRCVLKMDHHCPWLATCVGLRNYKAFLLFLIYVSLFCWQSFILSGAWVWAELFDDRGFDERLMPVNYILLAALGSIIGLVLTGFTSWHFYLACKGQTTIESLEKQRYMTALRQQFGRPGAGGRHYIDPAAADEADPEDSSLTSQIRNIHANMVPGVTRPEEGEDEEARMQSSPARQSLRHNMSYADREAQRERDRYNEYLDEEASSKLPHAFDRGVRNNLTHLFGDPWYLRWLPICNTTGDGWQWEPSEKWVRAREEMARERAARAREDQHFAEESQGWVDRVNYSDTAWNSRGSESNARSMPLRTFDSKIPPSDRRSSPSKQDGYSSSDDEQGRESERHPLNPAGSNSSTSNWNDIPEGFLDVPSRNGARSRSSQRRSSPNLR